MSYMFMLAGGIASLSLVIIWFVASPDRPSAWLRTSALLYTMLLLGVAPVAFYELLGRPKPVLIESLPVLTTVVSFVLDGKERVHLTVQNKIWDTPRLISLVWNEELVKKLVKQRRRAKEQGRKLGLRTPKTGDPTDIFYVLNPPPVPPKL